ncbi:hypothetical protein, partial [Colwellia sp. MB02u-10]|uniref:hypothetical protein n=1 Tax=Colwellia sp. MB02u-10 TaxID=2759828 RepID=UPI001C70F5CB
KKQLSDSLSVSLYPTAFCIRCAVDGLKSDLQNNSLNLHYHPWARCRLDFSPSGFKKQLSV